MKKLIQDFKIILNKRLTPDHFILELLAPEKLPDIFPGQFTQVLIENSINTFLRRPFSIHNVNYKKNTISLLICIIGRGTRNLSNTKEGNSLNLIYPLGNSFSLPFNNNVLLVGGGSGVAPLLFLAKYLNDNNIIPKILIGARSKKDMVVINKFKKIGEVYITTEDGSYGEKGLVTHHSLLKSEKNDFSKIYTCGPESMMKAICKFAQRNKIECEVSLENTMACGIGACLCCVVETTKGNK